MPASDADQAFLWDMLEAARSIQTLVAGLTFEQFAADRRTFRAVEREFEILGEAARNVSGGLRAANPEIRWTSIIGQRNVLAHEYGGIRYDLLWETVWRSVPALISQLEKLLPPPGVKPQS